MQPRRFCQLSQTVDAVLNADGYKTSILNGRFKGGWTTRHYGQPGEGHPNAIQMELAQSTLFDHRGPALGPLTTAKANQTCAAILKDILTRLETVALTLAHTKRGTDR